MNYEEALAWLRGERSTTNTVPIEPRETWCLRISEADAGNTQQAYWIVKAHREGLLERAEDDCNKFQDTVGKWGDDTFGVGVHTRHGIINHLSKEIIELAENHEPEEAADCFLLLLLHAHECGYNLFEEAQKKHEINLKRTWKKPDENGCIEHAKEASNE